MIPTFFKKLIVVDIIVAVIALLTLAGWHFDVHVLAHPVKNGTSMNPVTAILFIFCAASKFLFGYSVGYLDKHKKLLFAARTLAAIVLLAGAGKILSEAMGTKFIDSLLYANKVSMDTDGSANIMAFSTAFNFLLTGISLLYITYNNTKKIVLPHVLSFFVLFISLLSIVAYVFNESTFYGEGFFKPMSIPAAVCFLLLSFCILLVHPDNGFMGEITSKYEGGKIARFLLPVAITVPIFLGYLRLKGEAAGLYNQPYGTALFTLTNIVIFILFIWRSASIINNSNKKLIEEIEQRKKAEETIQYRKALLEAQNEATPDAILIVDMEGKILSYNKHFARLWNIPEEIINERDDAAALKFVMTQLADPNGFIHRINYIYTHPENVAHDEILFTDGRIVERYGNAVTNDNGIRYGWAWYFRDITLKKNNEIKIKNFSRDLETKINERTQELHKSEKRFRLLVENSLDIISLIDFEGRIIYMSPSIKRLTGFTEEELIGKSGFDLLHKDDLEAGKKLRTRLINMPALSINNSFRFLHKNGGYIWLEGTVTNMLNNENVKAFILNYHDITERKQAEEKIKKSEKHFRSLIENAQDIISLSDKNGIRFYVSPAIERITGFTIQETINKMVFDIVHPDDIERLQLLREEFMKEPGITKPLSCRFLHKNGGFVWIEGTIINLLNDESVKAVVGNFHDVTERKLSEEKIRTSNERFEMLSKATNDTVWDWNLETDEINWNEGIKSMFDYGIEDIATGSEWKVHIHPEDFMRVTKNLIYHIKNGIQNMQDEYRFRCANGTYKYIYARGFILFNNNNKPYRIIGAMQDVTEINKLQQSLNEERIKKQKELTNATIIGQEKERTLIGRELHDNINQLLTATKLYLNVASTTPLMKDEMIMRSAENLSKCMEEIRKLSSSLVPPSIGINSFVEVIKDLAEPIKLATAINISYKIDIENINMLTNNQQLNVYRIIQEHLNNILKHANAKNILIGIQQINREMDIHIKDDGKGFDVTAKRKGIGFKNIQSRAELLNGKMNIISRPGKGCMLVVNFPVSSATPLLD